LTVSLRQLNYGRYDHGPKAMVAQGMEEYLWQNKTLFKDYFPRNPSADKNRIARAIAFRKGSDQRTGMRDRHTGAESHV